MNTNQTNNNVEILRYNKFPRAVNIIKLPLPQVSVAAYHPDRELSAAQKCKLIQNSLFNQLLLNDTNLYNNTVHSIECTEILKDIKKECLLTFTGKEIIGGSFIAAQCVNNNIPFSDIDIYFRSPDDYHEFLSLNKDNQHINIVPNIKKRVCAYHVLKVPYSQLNINCIYGIKFNNIKQLLLKMDIRAIAMGLDLKDRKFYSVDGAVNDAYNKIIRFQPYCVTPSIARLIRYIKYKSFRLNNFETQVLQTLIVSYGSPYYKTGDNNETFQDYT